jgi:tetratricopeptide (TPR) repeat protein
VSKRDLAFLSYAHEDLAQVRKIYEGLKKRKVNVWFDEKNLKKDEELRRSIERTIAHSKSYVFCLSNAALKKTSLEDPGFLDRELHTAWTFAKERDAKDFRFVVARIEDCDRGDMRLDSQSQIDLFPDLDKGLDTLAVNLVGVSLLDKKAIDERTEEEKLIESMMGKGFTYRYSGEYEKSLSIFEAVININRDYYPAWYNKGIAHFDLFQPEKTLYAFNKVIKIKPKHHEAWFNIGVILDHLGRKKEAEEAFKKSNEILTEIEKKRQSDKG